MRPTEREKARQEALSDRPPYQRELVRVFPYVSRLNRGTAIEIGKLLAEEGMYHALTGFPFSSDMWLDIWLSKDAAEHLIDVGMITREHLTETLPKIA